MMDTINLSEKDFENYALKLLVEAHDKTTKLISYNASKLEELNQEKNGLEEQLVEDGEKAKQLFNSINFLKRNYVK